MIFTIAIDGPAGSGKSSVAKMVAERMGITYLDTGAMYRAITLKILRGNHSIEEGEPMNALLAATVLNLEHGRVWMDGEEITEAIRSQEVTGLVSAVSSLAQVRKDLVAQQQRIAAGKSIVMDGRDIGSKVLPNADLKIFLTARPEVRGKRRWLELERKGTPSDLNAIIADVVRRDTLDSSRINSPLVCTEDALLLDTSEMTIDAVCDFIVREAQQRMATICRSM